MMLRPIIGVRRDGGARHLLVTVVAFAVTVAAVRVYLDAAGYPRIGGGGLHVAHMLWGGLLLVVAALLPLLFVGRRALTLAALAAGVGVGLFIDEVGKFITESNDYFFAPAAPIIYGGVLVLLLVWQLARRPHALTRRAAVRSATEALGDLADGRLSAADRDRVVRALTDAIGDDPVRPLERDLLALLRSAATTADLAPPGWVARGDGARTIERLLPDRLEGALIGLGLVASVLQALVGLLFAVAISAGGLPAIPDPQGPVEAPTEPVWIALLGVVWIVVGVAAGAALIAAIAGHRERSLGIARAAVLIGLVAGGLLSVYVSQLGALSGVLLQVVLLLLVLDRQRRLARDAATVGAGGAQ